MSDHGPLFDSFTGQAAHQHDGSYFDIFDGREQGDKHGPLFDDNFRASRRTETHGNLWDSFEWKAMPVLHGARFDESFSEPSALSGTHGSWFDAFRGGAVARFILDGADFEGQVIDCNDEFATVKTRQGQMVEVGFPQFLSYASPNMHQAGPATTVVHSPGQEAPRTEVAADPYAPMESVTLAVKALRGEIDVAKVGVSGGGAPSVGTSFHSTCPSCKAPGGAMMVGTKHEHVGAPVASGKATCVHCGAEHPMQGTFFKTAPRALDVAKVAPGQAQAQGGFESASGTVKGTCPGCGKTRQHHGEPSQAGEGHVHGLWERRAAQGLRGAPWQVLTLRARRAQGDELPGGGGPGRPRRWWRGRALVRALQAHLPQARGRQVPHLRP